LPRPEKLEPIVALQACVGLTVARRNKSADRRIAPAGNETTARNEAERRNFYLVKQRVGVIHDSTAGFSDCRATQGFDVDTGIGSR
jgi:hypothetical protein